MAQTRLAEFSAAGMQFEIGRATTATGTIEVSTKLRNVVAAFGTYYEAPSASALYCDCVITSGCVTFADSANSAKEFMYLICGYA
jgi:hypothetical protein